MGRFGCTSAPKTPVARSASSACGPPWTARSSGLLLVLVLLCVCSMLVSLCLAPALLLLLLLPLPLLLLALPLPLPVWLLPPLVE